MAMATLAATRSKDPSTQVGAVIVGPDRGVRSTGYNGFPRKVTESEPRLTDRTLRLLCSAHAEQNAIYGAARTGTPLEGCTMYVKGLFPCAICAGAIIQTGIVRVVVTNKTERPERWAQSMNVAAEMFEEAGVQVDESNDGNQPDVIGTPADGPGFRTV